MIIEDCIRDENNEIFAIVAGERIHLTAEYVVKHKPQIGDTLVEESLEALTETPAEEPKTE